MVSWQTITFPKETLSMRRSPKKILIDLTNDLERPFSAVYDGAGDRPKKMSVIDGLLPHNRIRNNCRFNTPVQCSGFDYAMKMRFDYAMKMRSFWIKVLLVKRDHFDYKRASEKKGEAPEFSLLALDGLVLHANCSR
jgi:hypothetical protein